MKANKERKTSLFCLLILCFFCSTYVYGQNRQEVCEQEKKSVAAYNKRLMDYKSQNGKKYLDLIRVRNSINAAKVLNEALIKITQEYYDYLDQSTGDNLKNINKLQTFLQAQAPAAHKMSMATSMVTALKDLAHGKVEDRFAQAKNLLKRNCLQNPRATYCIGLERNFWNTISANGPTQPPGSHSSMVEHFLLTAAASKDLNKNFVQDPRFDQVLNTDPNRDLRFSRVLSKALDEAVTNCANRDYLEIMNTKGERNRCLNLKLDEIKSDPQGVLKGALGKTSSPVETLGDVITNYFEQMKRAKTAQLKLSGELFAEFGKMTNVKLSSADHKLVDESSRKRKRFHNIKEHLLGTIHGSFKLIQRQNNLDSFLKGATDEFDVNPSIDDTLESINASFRTLTGESEDLFVLKGQRKISFDRRKLAQLIHDNKLNTTVLKNYRNQLNDQMKQVNQELATLRKDKSFSDMEKLQHFAWNNMTRACSYKDSADMQKSRGPGCNYINGYNQGVQSLFNFNDSLLNLEQTQEQIAHIDQVLEYCNDGENMASQRELLDSTCNRARFRRDRLTDRTRKLEGEREYRRSVVSDNNFVYTFNKNGEVTGTRRRKNWRRQALNHGIQYGIATLLPPAIGFIHLKGSLLQTGIMAKQNKTFQAWRAAQATYPHNNCHIYVCQFNSSMVTNNLAVSRGYIPFGQTNSFSFP